MGLFNKKMDYEQALQVLVDDKAKDRDRKTACKLLEEFNKYSTVYSVGRILCIARKMVKVENACLEINRCLRDAEKNTPSENREKEIYQYLNHSFVFNFVNYFYIMDGLYQAAYYIANCYLYGWGVNKDKIEAHRAAKLAAEMDKNDEFWLDANSLFARLSIIVGTAAKQTESSNIQDKKATSEIKTYRCGNGDLYEGEMLNGEYHGKGKYTKAEKRWVYEGDFVNGQMIGQCKLTYKNGDVYQGEVLKGIWNGKGKHTYADGTYYEGDFKDGLKHGHGKFTEKSGDYTLIFEGDYIGGKREGRFEGHVIGGTSGKTYLYYFKADEKVGSMGEANEGNKHFTADEYKKHQDEYWRKSNEELHRNKAAGNVNNANVNSDGFSDYQIRLIKSWDDMMNEEYDGAIGGNAERFYNRFMFGISENFDSCTPSWDGNGFSSELDEVLSILTERNMTLEINKRFRDMIDAADGDADSCVGPAEVVCWIAVALSSACNKWELRNYRAHYLAQKLCRMLAYIAAFYMGTDIFCDYDGDKEAVNLLACSYYGYMPRNAYSLTHLYYSRIYQNEDASLPLSSDSDDEWANGELLNELLKGDAIYFDGWVLDTSELKSYYNKALGRLKYYGVKPPYNEDTPLVQSCKYAQEMLEYVERIFNDDFWEATKMLCDFLNFDVIKIKKKYELSRTDFMQFLYDLLFKNSKEISDESYYFYDIDNFINLCYAAYVKYDNEAFLYYARMMYFRVGYCESLDEVKENNDEDGDFISWLYFRRIELTGDEHSPIDDYLMDFNLDIWVENTYGDELDSRLASGRVMCANGYIRSKD